MSWKLEVKYICPNTVKNEYKLFFLQVEYLLAQMKTYFFFKIKNASFPLFSTIPIVVPNCLEIEKKEKKTDKQKFLMFKQKLAKSDV